MTTRFECPCGCAHDLVAREITEQLSPPEVEQLILELDARLGDWNTTLRLADHFAQLRLAYYRDAGEDEIAARLKPRFTATDQPYGRMPKVD